MKIKPALGLFCFCLLPSTFCLPAAAQGTAFTYQGRLNANGAPASGTYNLTFTLFNVSSGGSAVAGPVTNSAVSVTNGLFTVTIDLGGSVWIGATNWLEIGVETNGGNGFTTLSPRQLAAPTPYAIAAENLIGTVASAGLSGTYGNPITLSNGANVINGTFAGNGGTLTGVNATALNGLGASNFWQTAGNSGTTPAANFIGTTDFKPVEFKAGGMRVLRLEPDGRTNVSGVSGNLIGGFTNNLIEQPGSGANFIGSGGYPAGPNVVHSNSAGVFIGAGSANQIGPSVNDAFIGAGFGNSIGGDGFRSVIGGGNNNTNNEHDSVIGGGQNNFIETGAYNSVVGGGYQNTIQASANYATISGGAANTASAADAVVPGGSANTAAGIDSFAAGSGAQALHNSSFVWSDGTTFSSTGANQFLVHATGGVGIDTTSPGAALEVDTTNPNGNEIRFGYYTGGAGNLIAGPSYVGIATGDLVTRLAIRQSTGNVGIGTLLPDELLSVNGSADKIGGGSWDTFSDLRLKDISANFTRGLEALAGIQPVQYHYRTDNPLNLPSQPEFVGVVAQRVQPAVPEAVHRSPNGYLVVNNDPILWTMVNAIKELNQKVEVGSKEMGDRNRQAQNQIEELKAENAELKARLEKLEQIILNQKSN